MLLNFEKPKQIMTQEEREKKYSSDCGVPGTYVPNMSDEDNRRWKCKYVKGANERVEIRRFMGGANIVIFAYKTGEVVMSANSKMYLSKENYDEMVQIVQEARDYMRITWGIGEII